MGLRQDIMEAVERLAIYKFPPLSFEEIGKMLGVSDITQTRTYQEAMGVGEEGGRLSVLR